MTTDDSQPEQHELDPDAEAVLSAIFNFSYTSFYRKLFSAHSQDDYKFFIGNIFSNVWRIRGVHALDADFVFIHNRLTGNVVTTTPHFLVVQSEFLVPLLNYLAEFLAYYDRHAHCLLNEQH